MAVTEERAPRRESEPASAGGAGIAARIAGAVIAAAAAVMLLGGFVLYTLGVKAVDEELRTAGAEAARNLARGAAVKRQVGSGRQIGKAEFWPVEYEVEGRTHLGYEYRYPSRVDTSGRALAYAQLIIPQENVGRIETSLLGIVAAITVALIGVLALVATLVSGRVARPLRNLIDDVGWISRGSLDHRVRVAGTGEVGLLARAVDRMGKSLREARESERALEKREHDLRVVAEVRESLLPQRVPDIPGFEIAGTYRPAEEAGGDYYDFVELEEGRVGLLVAEVGAKGVPAGMVMTMARAYLRAEAARVAGPKAALAAANRALARDMRRGVYVSALYAVLDPKAGTAVVASAGHKVPCIRYCASDATLRVVQPEGIALGFDAGPVFERTLREAEVPLERGDRIVLATSGVFAVRNPEGAELGEKGFYALAKKEAPKNSEAFVGLVLAALERFAAETPFPLDVALATLKRR